MTCACEHELITPLHTSLSAPLSSNPRHIVQKHLLQHHNHAFLSIDSAYDKSPTND